MLSSFIVILFNLLRLNPIKHFNFDSDRALWIRKLERIGYNIKQNL